MLSSTARSALALLALLFATLAAAQPEGAAPALPPSLGELFTPIEQSRLFRSTRVGVQLVDVATGAEVYAHEADRDLLPASTMKVITAAVALDQLGPAYRFHTDLLATGAVDEAGVLQGDLIVRGTGDPTLVIEEMWRLVLDLKVEGVTQIRGDLVLDDSWHGGSASLPGWTKKEDIERGPSYFSTLSALSLNFNTTTLVVGPGAEVGGPARVFPETAAPTAVEVVSSVITGPAGSRRWLDIDREVEGPLTRFRVQGSVPAGGSVARYYRTVADPTWAFGAAFKELAATQGIRFTGKLRRGVTPSGADLLVRHTSPPLTAILMDMNKYSNNFMAEQVLRTVGAEVKGAPGTTDKGLEVVGEYLAGLGVAADEVRLVNGSGLSREGRLRPSTLTAVLLDMARNERVGHEFRASLAIAGMDGTLRRRLVEDPGRVRGKTGTIDGVHCLAGYVQGGDGSLYAFAFLVNGLRGGSRPARRMHDQFLRTMVNVGRASADISSGSTP